MTNDVAAGVTLKVSGRRIDTPVLPRVLQARVRTAGAAGDDPFLPLGYVRPVTAFDVSAAARSLEGGEERHETTARPGQVIALELADGITVFTSPERLRDTILRVAPQALEQEEGAVRIRLEAIRERGAATRSTAGEALSSLIARVVTLDIGAVPDAIIEAARTKALEWLREKGEERLTELPELGASWLGAKALMWAVESRLAREPGLYRWTRARDEAESLLSVPGARLEEEGRQGPLLVFVHGTASSTLGSYSDLLTASRESWRQLGARFGERIFAFEHRTLSESPIENALQLVHALPAGARLNLVTHSRGGLVGDLLCLDRLDGIDRTLLDGYAVDEAALGDTAGAERARVREELQRAYAEQRERLRELAVALRTKQLAVERYVRVACPARGTRLASSHFDVFLSGLLSLVGLVPALAVSPVYAAFRRVVLEVAKNRTNPRLVPGIEAMLPESPMARLLARATPQAATKMAVISGDIEGGGLLKRLGVLFTDNVFFDGHDNDLVVDTDSMYAGVARPGAARALFDRGPDVTHFRYFANEETRTALWRWLVEPNVDAIEAFTPLPGLGPEPSAAEERLRDEARRRTRGVDAAGLPIVVVLPGIMGSHLWRGRKDRVWFDFCDLLTGGLEKLRFGAPDIEAEKLFDAFYGDLCEHLATSHFVERFPYDWRLPMDTLADALAERLRQLLRGATDPERPVRLLAHSMGGLVVRALVHAHRDVWDALIAREGARLVMLGTPNQGSHLMVETLLGKSDTIRKLACLDVKHGLRGLLDIVGTFRGALQLLPRPGFMDAGGEQPGDYFDVDLWQRLQREVNDFWFGNGVVTTPDRRALAAGRWLWDRDAGNPALPAQSEGKVFYVHGCARNTPCGLRKEGGRWKMLGTPRGDGSVTWDSGAIPGIGTRLYMPVEHGALADSEEYFESLASLLARGEPGELLGHPPALRGEDARGPLSYDAGPPVYPTELELASGLLGRKPRVAPRSRARTTLHVRVRATDLRDTKLPLLVGHYEEDAITGPEAIIDRELVDGGLTMRYDVGTYAGPLGTATVVLSAPNEMERRRGSRRGAVVAGLGKYDGSLTVARLTEAVRTAALRYLLHLVDATGGVADDEDTGVPLASLLLGYNSSANLSIDDAVTALVRGVVEANRRFARARRGAASGERPLRIGVLEIVELYLDTAISTTYALRRIASELNKDATLGCRIEVYPQLLCDDSVRSRLEDARAVSYWTRIVATAADPCDGGSPPERDAASAAADVAAEPPAGGRGTGTAPAARRPAPSGRLAVAERLRFLYLGPRARAETIVQQRQPGLVEELVAQQLHVNTYQEQFSRTLFQLLLPHEFKDVVRRLDRVVMVLDGYTANLPWELMVGDDEPLAVKTALVRQLSSTRYRAQVRQTVARRAYVVGNPSTRGYAAAFPRARKEPDPLDAAEKEALAVAEVLTQHGYEVIRSIGQDQEAIDVINRLYDGLYRVLHIAAHGIFEETNADGKARTGVVLSGGLLITAAEIGAMEMVPELVFLNCCHLGKVDRAPSLNRLAYSVARELIEVGVRAVVVAGWAVEDVAGTLFADTFYRGLLAERKPFGESVFDARRAVWEKHRTSVTWGAYQAYGDVGWRIEPLRDESGSASGPAESWQPVAIEELIARVEQVRTDLGRPRSSTTEARDLARRLDRLARQVPDKKWLDRPDVCAAFGRAYAELGGDHVTRAAELLAKAIRGDDKPGRAPIWAVEQLANVEARRGEAIRSAAHIEVAIGRLLGLARIAAGAFGEPDPKQVNGERAGLLGSAYKRLAAVHARRYLDPNAAPEVKEDALRAMDDALRQSERWYHGRVDLDAQEIEPYPALNWLFLATLTLKPEEKDRSMAFAQRCAATATARFRAEPDFWNAVVAADAFLAESLLDGSLASASSVSRVERLAARYDEAMAGMQVKGSHVDSTVRQMSLLALLHAVRARANPADTTAAATAEALRQLARKLSPGACEDDSANADLPEPARP